MITISQLFVSKIIAHAQESDPIECCGVLAGPNNVFEKLTQMTNVDNSPFRFSWNQKELLNVYLEMEDNNWTNRAVYHSHTHSEAYPSDTDIRMAGWPEAHYIIVSLMNKTNPILRSFRIVDGLVEEETIEVI